MWCPRMVVATRVPSSSFSASSSSCAVRLSSAHGKGGAVEKDFGEEEEEEGVEVLVGVEVKR